mmetsp:Transcript_41722/g.129254  ORF Transcript_41722/g.129254 Transcript_41722/m.129254 type:complete len:375 (-) Transcript_41722:148-1272(-)
MAASREARLASLVQRLLSPAVQVPLPAEAGEVPPKLSPQEVEKVFTDNVPGVRGFLFRQKPGQPSLKFLVSAYREGLRAFKGTALDAHLARLLRLVVHRGHEGRPGAARHLADVAEAFMDCQAVQARAIERVGLQLQGLAPDFEGLVLRLIGEYKTLALRMLAAERLTQGYAQDYDRNPTHYENRLTADLGHCLGLNADDVRRAELDEHAEARYLCLEEDEAEAAAARCRELFDVEALLSAFVAEVNSFHAGSPPESLPRCFLDWASQHLSQKHAVMDAETCMRVDVDRSFALAVLEALFLGQPADMQGLYRGVPLRRLFRAPPGGSEEPATVAPAEKRGPRAQKRSDPAKRSTSPRRRGGRRRAVAARAGAAC